MALTEQLLYDSTDVFVPRTVLYASQLNTVMGKAQTEMEVRDSLWKGWFAIPTMTAVGGVVTVTVAGDGCIVAGQRFEGSVSITLGGASGGYTIQVKSDGTLYQASSPNSAYLTVGTLTFTSPATVSAIVVTATVGQVLTGVGDVSGPGASVDGNLAAFNGTGGDTLQDAGVAMSDAVTAVSLMHTELHDSEDHTSLGEDSANHSGLDYAYQAGAIRVNNVVTEIAAGTVTLTDDDTNYVEVDTAGTVSANVVGFTNGRIPLAEVVVASTVITGATDRRVWLAFDQPVSSTVHTTGNESIDGVKTFTSSPIAPTPDGATPTQVATVGYVDSVAVNRAWQDPVLSVILTAPPGGETTGDRYIPKAVAGGAWVGKENWVAEYNGAGWDFYEPEDGWTLINTGVSPFDQYTWNASTLSWVLSGAGAEAYTASNGVKLVANDVQIDLSDTNPALEVSDGGVRAKVDNSSIERTASGLAVKAVGVTNAMLAGSIENTKLAQLTTPGMVDGASLTLLANIPAGAGVVPVDNLGTGAVGSGVRTLRDDGTWGVDASATANTTVCDVDVISYGTANVVWSAMPVALSDFREESPVYSRFKFDASTASQYRIVALLSVAGSTGADINLQYSANDADWSACDTASAGETAIDSTGFCVGAWANLVAGAQGDVYFKIVGKDGNASTSPAWRMLRVQFKVPGGLAGAGIDADTLDGSHADEFLLLDQTTPQTVQGFPAFDDGVAFGATPTVGAHSAGKTYWDATWKTLGVMLDGDSVLQVGQETMCYVYNGTGSPITEGQAVYIAGAQSGVPSVALAKADAYATSFVLGVVTTASIAHEAYGYVTIRGHVNDLNTDSWTVNDTLYLSPDTAGALTNVQPSGGQYDVRIGRVMIKDPSAGRVYVNVRPESRLVDLSDVTVVSPSVDEVLRYNGVEWVNGAPVSSSAAPGIEFFPDTTDIIAKSAENAFTVETLNKYPVTTAESVEAISCASNTVIGSAYLYDAALGRTVIDSGNWAFDFYLSVSSVLSGRVSTVTNNLYKVSPYTVPTVSITGSGTSRTCTASGGTPFATTKIDASATNTAASFVQTPKGMYQITARTSDTEVTIETPTGYSNESTVAFSVWKKLFGATSPTITNLTTNYGLYSLNTAQSSFVVDATDKLGLVVFATSNNTTTVNYVYNGTSRYSHFTSPLITLHNNIAGLQGGTSNEYYHLTSAQQTAVANSIHGATVDTAVPEGASDEVLIYDNTNSANRRVTLDTLSQRKETIVLTAGGGWPSTTGGCAASALLETATNKQNLYTAAFDKDTDEYMEWSVIMPDNWDGGTVTAVFYWQHPATTTNFGVVWGLQGRAYANDDALDQAWGTAQVVNDTGGTTGDLYITSATSAITLAGSPAGGQLVQFRAYRDANDGTNDTLAVDAYLMAVKVEYGINKWSA